MAPNVAAPQYGEDYKPHGIRAVLLGPPGSGKGTQVNIFAIFNNKFNAHNC